MEMDAAAIAWNGRQSLDRLVAQMTNPVFVVRYRRVPSGRELSGHASPAILELSGPRSRYVRSWRRHARRCAMCAATFRYLGLAVD
jgi:hypothetical protein